jgi:hypothetical protein
MRPSRSLLELGEALAFLVILLACGLYLLTAPLHADP